MRILIADLLAICVIGLLVGTLFYSLPPHLPVKEYWLLSSAICTAALGIITVHSWRYDPEISSVREWATLCLGGWAFSIVLFLLACWLRGIPVSDALHLPPALWGSADSYWLDRPFWWATISGPGLTIMATASLVRTTALKLSGVRQTPHYERNTIHSRSPLWQEEEKHASWSSFWFYVLILPFFGIVLGHGTWISYEILDGQWMLGALHLAIWIPLTALGIVVLHRAEFVRYQISLAAITIFLAGMIVVHFL